MKLVNKPAKILIVFGTRPEAIKMAPLIEEFSKHKPHFLTKVCVTAQHREMLDQVLEFFEILPDYDLNLMKKGQDLYDITANVLKGMKTIIQEYKPDLIFVHGDTSTTFAVALAAFYQQVRVAHVEAGLRTGNIYSPWPEEANRQLTSQISNFHLAPTITSKNNLLRENVKEESVCTTGNTVIDALMLTTNKIKNNSELENSIVSSIVEAIEDTRFNLNTTKFILVTGHRRENHGQGFVNICQALKKLAQDNPTFHIIYPVHLNPNVQKPVNTLLSGIENIHLIAPLKYEQFIYLMFKSFIIITDSGGVQEEAPSLGKPVLVMRETTERPEALTAGTVKLVGVDAELIVKEAQNLIDNTKAYEKMALSHNPYGDGKASKRIINFISENVFSDSINNSEEIE
jgi:UDP-N-acetylglucosamine 2-epimerase (non-hydrolysing)